MAFYERVLSFIAAGLEAGAKVPRICAALNAASMPSATGSRWTPAAVTGVLARLRKGEGHFYTSALRLHLDGVLTAAQVRTLCKIIA